MTWLLIVVLGASISSSMVTEAQCWTALSATETVAARTGLRPDAFCVTPQGSLIRLGAPT